MGDCQPFAIMRLTHEAIRSGLNEIEALVQKENTNVDELISKYRDVKRTIQLHAKQEEDVFYVVLGKKVDGVTTAFSEEHHNEHEVFAKIDGLIASVESGEDPTILHEALLAWREDHLGHLLHEEKDLMEILPKVFTYIESVGVVRSIISYDINEFESYQLKWVYERLNPKQQEVYLGMLKGCSPQGKFSDFEQAVQR